MASSSRLSAFSTPLGYRRLRISSPGKGIAKV